MKDDKKLVLICIGIMVVSLIGVINNLGIENKIGLGPYDIAWIFRFAGTFCLGAAGFLYFRKI
jgi:hypothetical protein